MRYCSRYIKMKFIYNFILVKAILQKQINLFFFFRTFYLEEYKNVGIFLNLFKSLNLMVFCYEKCLKPVQEFRLII